MKEIPTTTTDRRLYVAQVLMETCLLAFIFAEQIVPSDECLETILYPDLQIQTL